jgi:hypothetical protein
MPPGGIFLAGRQAAAVGEHQRQAGDFFGAELRVGAVPASVLIDGR